MPMNHRLLRPRQTIHPEAADWANRVRTNGGSVSGTTLSAVDRFVKAIHAAGIRDRFYRLNLFCGNSDANLAAVRTPLFRGPSLTGTQYGGTTDTNNNFVAGDYAETGASGGLTGNGSTKYLQTGFSPDNLPSAATGHISSYVPAATASGNRYHIGSFNLTHLFGHRQNLSGDAYFQGAWGFQDFITRQFVGTTALPGGLWMTDRSSATLLTYYLNGASSGTYTTSVAPASHSREFYVFALNNNGSLNFVHNYGMRGYSIGLSMTASQAAAYYTAMQTFQVALRRDRPSSDPMFASVTNEDAKLWIDNVYTNGGTVSAATANAVNAFCNSIDAAGIRDRFYRLNLFAGNSDASLAAVRTPLYRGPSLTGTQYGNTTDTNNNFVAGDYAETGASGGLKGADTASAKRLDTGVAISTLTSTDFHASAYVTVVNTASSFRSFMGASSTNGFLFGINASGGSPTTRFNFLPANGIVANTHPAAMYLGTQTANKTGAVYLNGSLASSTYTTADNTDGAFSAGNGSLRNIRVMTENRDGDNVGFYRGTLGGYSFGPGMTAAQALAYYTAMQAFQTALGRQV